MDPKVENRRISARPARRVALACQGGGSHTAFTAGVLKRVLAEDGVEVVGFSGASGGAVSALLAQYGMLTGGGERAGELLQEFWEENTASGVPEAVFNYLLVQAQRVEAQVGHPAADPYHMPQTAREELARLISSRVDFERLRKLSRRRGPRLMIGAVEVLTGEQRLFDSAKEEISLEAVLASCAVPTIFRAERVGDGLYWDGLFSQNPPIRELPETGCDEIWVIQIDPSEREEEPRTAAQILDRTTQLSGNLSLEQEIHFIETLNRLVESGKLAGEGYRSIPVRRIALPRDLDTASKLDRSPAFIANLFADGEREAERFLEDLSPLEAVQSKAVSVVAWASGVGRKVWELLKPQTSVARSPSLRSREAGKR